jgi:hypothetical protein
VTFELTVSPLRWPDGVARSRRIERSRFDATIKGSRDQLLDQLRIMGARNALLTTDMELRRDGLPYAKQSQPADKGIAVYFLWRGKQMTFACDRWDRVEDNIRAIGKTIEAIRGIERWGASDMMERAFSAFEALPPPSGVVTLTCWQILNIEATSDLSAIERAYRIAAKAAHPNAGGTREEWDSLTAAFEQAKATI